MLLRDKILAQLLELYVPSMNAGASDSAATQCFVNQQADDVLEALVMKNDVKFLTQSVAPLLKVE